MKDECGNKVGGMNSFTNLLDYCIGLSMVNIWEFSLIESEAVSSRYNHYPARSGSNVELLHRMLRPARAILEGSQDHILI